MPEPTNHAATLAGKLKAVTEQAGPVARDGVNTFQNYKYTSAEAMLTALRGPLTACGVVLTHALTGIEDREYTTAKGKASVITTVRFEFTFTDADTGYQDTIMWAGRGDDNADKGLGKAMTNAVKTFLRAQFLIPSGDDPEADHATDARAADRVPARTDGRRAATVEQFAGLKMAWDQNTPTDADANALLDELDAPIASTPGERIALLDSKQVLDLTRRLSA